MKSQEQSVISPQSNVPATGAEISHAFVPVQIQAPRAPAMPERLLRTQSRLPATLPIRMQVRLPNGVEVDLGEARLDDLTGVMRMLSALPCSS